MLDPVPFQILKTNLETAEHLAKSLDYLENSIQTDCRKILPTCTTWHKGNTSSGSANAEQRNWGRDGPAVGKGGSALTPSAQKRSSQFEQLHKTWSQTEKGLGVENKTLHILSEPQSTCILKTFLKSSSSLKKKPKPKKLGKDLR